MIMDEQNKKYTVHRVPMRNIYIYIYMCVCVYEMMNEFYGQMYIWRNIKKYSNERGGYFVGSTVWYKNEYVIVLPCFVRPVLSLHRWGRHSLQSVHASSTQSIGQGMEQVWAWVGTGNSQKRDSTGTPSEEYRLIQTKLNMICHIAGIIIKIHCI